LRSAGALVIYGEKVARLIVKHKSVPDQCETVLLMPRPANPQQALGAAIRGLRVERDLKQLDVAEDAGITVSHLSKIETGKVNPTWGTVTAIAKALKVTVAEIAERAGSGDQHG
jgi:DNA-binding XRE family transcriptional regulator